MFVYVGMYAVFALLSLAQMTRAQQNKLVFSGLLFLIVFVGTRFETGCDFHGYVSRFSNLALGPLGGVPLESLPTMAEPGYYLFTFLIKQAGLGFVWVNFLAAIIFFTLMYRFIRNNPWPLLLLTLTIPLLVIQLSMSGVRQALAVGFLMAAFDAFIKVKRLHVIIFILIGATFHTSVIIFLPLAFMVGREFSFWRVAGSLAVLTPVALFLLSGRLGVYQDRYIDEIYGAMNSTGAYFRVSLIVLSAIVFELNKEKVEQFFPKEYNLMRMFSLASFALLPIMLVNTVMAHRIGYYIAPIQLYTLSVLPLAMFPSKFSDFKTAQLAVLGVYGMYILVWFTISRHASLCYIPYQSYLF